MCGDGPNYFSQVEAPAKARVGKPARRACLAGVSTSEADLARSVRDRGSPTFGHTVAGLGGLCLSQATQGPSDSAKTSQGLFL